MSTREFLARRDAFLAQLAGAAKLNATHGHQPQVAIADVQGDGNHTLLVIRASMEDALAVQVSFLARNEPDSDVFRDFSVDSVEGARVVQTTSGSTRALPQWIGWIKSDGKLLVGLIGAVLYGIIRVGSESFYGNFQLSSNDVGISQATTLGRAALYLVIFLLAIAAIVGLSEALFLRFMEQSKFSSLRQRVSSHHWHARDTSLPALCGVLLLITMLPIALAFLAPELLAFLLGADAADSPKLRSGVLWVSLTVWCGLLVLCLYALMRRTCPSWNVDQPSLRWRLASTAVFVPIPVVMIVTYLAGPERFNQALETWLLVWPMFVSTVVLIFYCHFRFTIRRPAKDGDGQATAEFVANKMTVISVLTASIAFYLILLPLSLSFANQSNITRYFPRSEDLVKKSDDQWSARLPLVKFSWLVGVWLLVVLVLALTSWWTTACTRKRRLGPEPVSVRAGFIGMIALVGLGLLLLADDRGAVLAETVKRGDRIHQWGGIIPLTAEPVCVTGGAFMNRPGPYMFLGKAGNRLVLFDPSGTDRPLHGPLTPDDPLSTRTKTLLIPENGLTMTFLNADEIGLDEWNLGVRTCAGVARELSEPGTTQARPG